MLIEKRRHEPIRSGAVTVLLRRWKNRQASAGGVYRTAAGRIAVDDIVEIKPSRLTGKDARAAGYRTVAEALADLRGDPSIPLYLLRIRYLDEPDPRSTLAATEGLTDAEVAAIDARLDRLDRASGHGPWTVTTLRLIEANQARRAPDLAEMVGRETAPFKIDVRKLKNMGLTISLTVGYLISPRGAEYLRRTKRE